MKRKDGKKAGFEMDEGLWDAEIEDRRWTIDIDDSFMNPVQ